MHTLDVNFEKLIERCAFSILSVFDGGNYSEIWGKMLTRTFALP